MVQSPAATAVIEKRIRIDARPDVVYEYFTDPVRMKSWFAPDVLADARPGGVLRLNYNGFDIARGEYVELVPSKRVVFTFGWETLGDGPPPGANTVEIHLEPDGAGTQLTLVHRGWFGSGAEGAEEGWGQLLGVLAERVAGRGEAPTLELTKGEAAASALNTKLIELRHAIESASPAKWQATTPDEGWTGAAATYHALQHCQAIRAIGGLLQGQPAELERLGNERDANNARQAEEHRADAREVLLREVLTTGPQAVDTLRALSEEDLARTYSHDFLGGRELTVEQLSGALAGSLFAHIESLKQTLG